MGAEMKSSNFMRAGLLLALLSGFPHQQAAAEQIESGHERAVGTSGMSAGGAQAEEKLHAVMPDGLAPQVSHPGHDVTGQTQSHGHAADTGVQTGKQPPVSQAALQPKSPNHFIVTLVEKDSTHPFHGIGDRMGFAVNGVQGAELVVERGKTYFLEVKSNPMHDVYLSGDRLGWGASVVEDGVKGNFVYEGVIEFTPNEKTPDVVFYQCQNHKAMGGRVFVVDPGAGNDLASLIARHGKLREDDSGSGAVAEVSGEEIMKKLSYAKMVAISKPAKRVKQSGHAQANALLEEALGMLDQARAKHEAGSNNDAIALIDEALRKMSAASKMVPSDDVVAEQKQRYQDLLKALNDNRKSHQAAAQKAQASAGKSAVIKYDEARVDALVRKAADNAAASGYAAAISSLQEADRLVTEALNGMLKSQTVVYQLNLDTPQGEYQYEMNRYLGYVDLVPVALAEKQPNPGQKTLFDGYVNKGGELHAKALEFAGKGQYPEAIRLLQDATKEVQRGLRLLGVKE